MRALRILHGDLPLDELTGKGLYDVLDLCLECKGCKQKNPINIFATPGRSNIYTCNYCNENLFVGRYDNELVSFVRGYVDNLRYNLVIGPYYIPDEDYHEP